LSTTASGSQQVDALIVSAARGDELRVARIRLPFELSARQGRKAFVEWAEEHELPVRPVDLQATFSEVVSQGGTGFVRAAAFDGPAPALLPFWCFIGPHGSPEHGYAEVWTCYAGKVFDSGVVGETLADELDTIDALSGGVLVEHGAAALVDHAEPIGRRGGVMAVKAEEAVVRVGPAWGMLQAADRNAEATSRHQLKSAHLLLLPGYAFSYEYLGLPMVAWVCGRTGKCGGVSHRAPWANLVPGGKDVLRHGYGGLLQLEQRVPGAARPVVDIAVRAAGVAGAVAMRHPKIALVALAVPFAYKVLAPVASMLYSKAQAELQRSSTQGQHEAAAASGGESASIGAGGGSGVEEEEADAQWAWLLRKGPPPPPSPEKLAAEVVRRQAAAEVEIDWNDPFSVLGVGGDVTRPGLERAFRARMLAWHPDRAAAGAQQAGGIGEMEAQRRTVLLQKAFQELKVQTQR
jgi:hypothetical protein